MGNMIELVFDSLHSGSNEADIFSAMIFEAGADGINETSGCLSVFFSEEVFNNNHDRIMSAAGNHNFIKIIHEPQNWNSEWEKNYPPVIIGNKIVVYAPFHTDIPDLEHRILINPGMAFGTGHHSTTSLMLQLMCEIDFSGKRVIDMGCGSGVLAIMASKLNAVNVLAIDNDKNSYENCILNINANNCKNIICIEGNAKNLEGQNAEIFLANITRNILLADFDNYYKCISPGGLLLLSGFLADDLIFFDHKATDSGMKKINVLNEKEWAAVAYLKPEN